MKKIAYIGHNFHQKTLSTQFFINILKQNYKVDFYWTLPFKYKLDLQNFDINSKDYHAILFFQIHPSPSELDEFNCQNLIIIPMFDNNLSLTYSQWAQYYHCKFINFSRMLFDKLNFLGISNNLYLQYAPKIDNEPVIKNIPSKNKFDIFFWQRGQEINWTLIKKLLDKNQVNSVHMHRIESEADKDTWFIKPDKQDIEDYNISFSSWFESKNDLLAKINACDVFITPRLYEGIGQTFLEAMALGKCVISPDYPTMNEYITHNYNGLLFNFLQPEQLDITQALAIGKNAETSITKIRKKWLLSIKQMKNFIDAPADKKDNNHILLSNIEKLNRKTQSTELSFLKTDFSLYDNSNTSNSNAMIFSKYLNAVYEFLAVLGKDNNKYIIYGAGTGAQLIINLIPEKIDFIVDVDPKKNGQNIKGIPVSLPEKLLSTNNKIIISVIGRFDKLADFLLKNYKINKERLISLDI